MAQSSDVNIDGDTQNGWILGASIPGVSFSMNQRVHVIAGPHIGAKGRLISIYSLGTDPLFHLEAENGNDYHVHQSELVALDT